MRVDPVEAQLEAYNARDLERFLACYTPDVVIEDGAGKVLLQGHDGMRQVYGRLFAGSPNLHCQLQSRIRVGAYVIDEERVLGFNPKDPDAEMHAVAIYRVEDGLIAHARMLS